VTAAAAARTFAPLVILPAAVAGWLWSLSRTDVTAVGDFGLLATVHPAFFAAPALGLLGFVTELAGTRRRSAVLAAYTVVVIAIIHATTPVLLSQPQYAWTYKHIGVARLIAEQGSVSSPDDIYQQWPALLTAIAQLADVAGVDPLTLAPWAPVTFNLLGSVLLFALARVISPHPRTPYLAVMLFQCLNWIEQDYLAPQGLAFLQTDGDGHLVGSR
jgi:hypothetical protein